MSDPRISPCVRCGRPTIRVHSTYYTLEHLHAGLHLHYGRGLCGACWGAARRDGTLRDYERVTRPIADVIEDWRWIESDLPADASFTRRIRLGAKRLGMTYAALGRALYRAGITAQTEKKAS